MCGQIWSDFSDILYESKSLNMLPLDQQYIEVTVNGKSEKIPSLVRKCLEHLNDRSLNYRPVVYCCNGMWLQLSPFKFELLLCDWKVRTQTFMSVLRYSFALIPSNRTDFHSLVQCRVIKNWNWVKSEYNLKCMYVRGISESIWENVRLLSLCLRDQSCNKE